MKWPTIRCIAFFFLHRSAFSSIISESNARLPMSLSTVITDMEAEGISQLTTACMVSSRGTTQQQKGEILGSIVGEDADLTSSIVFGTDNGLAIAIPPASSIHEVASTALACGGNVVYYPSPEDLSRGEGLFEGLAPAMERILSTPDGHSSRPTSLIVVVEGDADSTKAKLKQSCQSILSNIISEKDVSELEDIFDSVVYVDPTSVKETLMKLQNSDTTPTEAASAVANTVATESLTSYTSSAGLNYPNYLAAARKLRPAAQKVLASTLQTVRDNTISGDEETPQLVPGFGSLCDAAISKALEKLDSETLLSTEPGKKIRENLNSELFEQLGDLFEEQLKYLYTVSFEQFKQGLASLRVSPNLASDMDKEVSKSLISFTAAAKKLQAKKAPWSFSHTKTKYRRMLQEYCADRLLAARASGKFRPLPKKGVTVGLHWLLPKPFGNDFRQEPWNVHATDNMVYVPEDKITDINPADVHSGDWRSKVVPSPAGNEMLYNPIR